MSLVRIAEDSGSVIRLVPGPVPAAATGACVLLGAGFSVAAALLVHQPVQFLIMLMVSCAFFLVAFMVRSQRRSFEINLADKALYVMGRQQPDMYVIPFSDIACLRVTRKVPVIRVSMREIQRGDQFRHERPGKPRYALDVVRHDSGFETLDTSVTPQEIARLTDLLASRTGLSVDDEAGLELTREAAFPFPADVAEAPHSPPPGSVIRYERGRSSYSWVWTLSPGTVVLLLMGLVGLGMLAIGAIGILEILREGGSHWVGVVAALLGGVLAYQISWRFMYGVFCTRYIHMDHEGLHCGHYCMDTPNEHVSIPFSAIATLRVIAPRQGRCWLEVLTTEGERHTLASLTPGLYPLTVGDLHWMNASLADTVRRMKTH